ncbi:MAG: XRE family transcriptional regulator, partial [Candidatus Sericytochromatia bacterium]
THIAVIVALISTMKDEGLDFYPIFEKIKSYSKE